MILPFSISEAALEELKKIATKKGFIEIGVEGTACAGLTHKIEIIENTTNHFVYNVEGINFAIKKDQLIYLINLKIDSINGEFSFENPNLPEEVDACEL